MELMKATVKVLRKAARRDWPKECKSDSLRGILKVKQTVLNWVWRKALPMDEWKALKKARKKELRLELGLQKAFATKMALVTEFVKAAKTESQMVA